MTFRAYQKDAQLKADAAKEIADDTDTIQQFRNNILAPMVAKYLKKYPDGKISAITSLTLVCKDAEVNDIDEGASQIDKFNVLLKFVDEQNYLPNLSK